MLRDVVVTGMKPVFLLPDRRERWNLAEARDDIAKESEGRETRESGERARPCGPLAFCNELIAAEGVHEGMPNLAFCDGVVIV